MDRGLIWDIIQECQERLRKNMKNLTADIRNGYLLNTTEILLLAPNCSVAELVTRYDAYLKTPSSSLYWDQHAMVDDWNCVCPWQLFRGGGVRSVAVYDQ
jgi:hypothetical protein